MTNAVEKLVFGSTLLLSLLGASGFGCAFELPFADPGRMKARVVRNLLDDHIKSFYALEGLLQVYLMSYRGALQESLVVHSRWFDELKNSGDLAGATARLEPGGGTGEAGSGVTASGYFLHDAKDGLQLYIDGSGEFHLVRVFGGGKTHADIVIGFDPLREALMSMAKKPRGVALFDEKNGTGSRIFQRGRAKVGKGEPGKSPDEIAISLNRIGRVRLSKSFSLDGSELLLIAEYGFPSVESRFVLFGLFIVFALAILIMVSTGASVIRGTAVEGRDMRGESGDDDIVNQIDREISAGVSGRRRLEDKKEAPVSEDKELKETSATIDEVLEEGPFDTEDQTKGQRKTLEEDGITIKKSR